MSGSEVTRAGLRGHRPGREAAVGGDGQRPRRGRGGEPTVVPAAQPTSYYGLPVLNQVVWSATDIAGYLFCGGLAGASSVLAAGAELTGRPALARAGKLTALGAISASVVALVHDLGRPSRFLYMLRVFKPTSPMSVGSWLLATYGIGRVATRLAALVGPGVAAYTAVLLTDTAVPAWHEGYREMPFVFVGSAAVAAGGAGLLAAPAHQAGPARNAALLGAVLELAATERMRRRMGELVAEPYQQGRSGRLMRAAKVLTLAGALGAAVFGGRSRAAAALAGVALLAGSACTRFGVFHAGRASAADPKYTVVPQRARLNQPKG